MDAHYITKNEKRKDVGQLGKLRKEDEKQR
jgi:hypothetical protein